MKVTAKLHGLLLGLHQDITLAESVAFLWYLRQVSVLRGTFYTNSLDVQRVLEDMSGTQLQRTARVDL